MCVEVRCRDAVYFDGAPEEGNLTQYVDGGDATYVWGFQGGVMIQPVISVPPELGGGGDCVSVTLQHLPDPAHPELSGEIDSYRGATFRESLQCAGDRCGTSGLFDVVGVNAPDGVRFLLDVTVRGASWARHARLALRIVDEDGFDECDALTRERDAFGVCEFTRVAGIARIDAIAEGDSCEARVDVTMTLEPTSTLPSECGVALTHTVPVERGCADALSVGDMREVSWRIPDDPTCTPPTGGSPQELFPFGDAPLLACCE